MARSSAAAALKALHAYGLRFPGAHLKHPWPGHEDLAVNDKTFAFLSVEAGVLRVTCKLPETNGAALTLPFVSPAAYGLAKSGWVVAEVPKGQAAPVELFKAWLAESYRAQAPKKLVAQLDGKPAAKRASAKKPARRRG